MTSTVPRAVRTLRVLVAAVVLAGPTCAWLCTAPRASSRDGEAVHAGREHTTAPCHGGHDEPSPARGSTPCADGKECCGGCASPALVSTAASPSDAAPTTGQFSPYGVGLALASFPLPPVGVPSRQGPPPAATFALRAVETVVLRL